MQQVANYLKLKAKMCLVRIADTFLFRGRVISLFDRLFYLIPLLAGIGLFLFISINFNEQILTKKHIYYDAAIDEKYGTRVQYQRIKIIAANKHYYLYPYDGVLQEGLSLEAYTSLLNTTNEADVWISNSDESELKGIQTQKVFIDPKQMIASDKNAESFLFRLAIALIVIGILLPPYMRKFYVRRQRRNSRWV